MLDQDFQNAVQRFIGGTPPRTWSLVVTVFGDLAQGNSDTISGTLLSDILSPVGIKPEALRVALHRLRNDGWIETAKSGRTALHKLSAFGREQSALAAQRIYAPMRPANARWHIASYAPKNAVDEHKRAKAMRRQGYVALSTGVYLANKPAPTGLNDALIMDGPITHVPDWLITQLTPADLAQSFAELSEILRDLHAKYPDLNTASPLQIATLRVLIVHQWRRLILKTFDGPDALFGAHWPGHDCRSTVQASLALLPRPALSALV